MTGVDGDWRAIAHANALLDLRRPAEAEQGFREVLAGNPESVEALTGLARALNEQGQHGEAETVVRRAISLEPEEVGGLHLLCDILCDSNNGRGALVAAEKALALSPHSFISHHQHALALISLPTPRARDAHLAAQRAVELAPHNPDGHNIVALCLSALGDEEGARQALRAALALDPHHVNAQNNLAAIDLDRGRLARAANALRSAVGNHPQEKLLHQNLDVLLIRLGTLLGLAMLAVATVLGLLSVLTDGWWPRALTGTAFLLGLAVLIHLFRRRLPRGFLTVSSVWRRANWQGRSLLAAMALLSGVIVVLSLSPTHVAASVAGTAGNAMRLLGVVYFVAALLGFTRTKSDR